MDKVQHFEIPADDMARAKQFYTQAFDWQAQDMSGGTPYTMVYTTEVNEQFVPKEAGAINGGLVQRDTVSANPVIVITVADIEGALAKVKVAGGEVITPPKNVMEMGMYAHVKDTEGNIIGVWQDLQQS